MTAREWLATRAPGGLSSPLARLLANAYVEELGAELEQCSAVIVIDLLRDSPRTACRPTRNRTSATTFVATTT